MLTLLLRFGTVREELPVWRVRRRTDRAVLAVPVISRRRVSPKRARRASAIAPTTSDSWPLTGRHAMLTAYSRLGGKARCAFYCLVSELVCAPRFRRGYR